jgi:phosphoribosylformimino-5-aminoimidazole carboxamide ribotide isomerase
MPVSNAGWRPAFPESSWARRRCATPQLVIEACKAHPGRIAVGIDARGGRVAVEGWAETSDVTALDLARRFEDAGVAAIIYTDIDRDGALQGVNVQATADLARAISIPVIASGGVASLDDLRGSDGGGRVRHRGRDQRPGAL